MSELDPAPFDGNQAGPDSLRKGLDPDVAEALARQRPELVGHLDGAPIRLPYEANAAALRREVAPALESVRLAAAPGAGSVRVDAVLKVAREGVYLLTASRGGDSARSVPDSAVAALLAAKRTYVTLPS